MNKRNQHSSRKQKKQRRKRLRMETLETRRLLATLTVNTTDDAVDIDPGDGVCSISASGPCSLRAAIQEANALDGADQINLHSGTYTLSIAGIGEQQASSGDLDITQDLVIAGAGADTTIVDAASIDRVFDVVRGNVTIRGVTVQGGLIQDDDDVVEGAGGGIRNEDTLTILDSVVSGNISTIGAGVGSYNANLTIQRSVISGNGDATTTRGGGIASYSNYDPGTLQVIDSTISGNQAGTGGGISNRTFDGTANATIERSTLSGNTATSGAGIANRSVYYYSTSTAANLIVRNSTLSGNIANSSGGGIHNEADNNTTTVATIDNSTIAGNTATVGNGGGIFTATLPSATATLLSTVVSGNISGLEGPDVSSANVSATFSLITDGSGHSISDGTNSNLVGQDPLLGPLADNGGLTQTHELLENSPAIDQGSNVPASGSPLTSDQRGSAFLRLVDDAGVTNSGDGTDIGAVEVGQVPATLDFGDAPEAITVAGILRQYPTTLASDGARHVVTQDGPSLGTVAGDTEPDAVPSSVANGDDQSSLDDEDSIDTSAIILTPGESLASLSLTHQGGAVGAILNAWLDLNVDGDWDDPGEQLLTNVAVPAGSATTSLGNTILPETTSSGTTFLRVRISTDGGLTPRGEATDGEVEDFALTIGEPPPQVADLSLTQTVSNENPELGQEITFTVTVRNDGPDQATNVEVTSELNNDFTFEQSTVTQGDYDDFDGLWNLGTLNSGATAVLTITATVDSSDSILNVAEITAMDQIDPDSTPDNGVVGEDDQAAIQLGTCLTGGPLVIGMNQLVYSCAAPGSFSAFVQGTTRGPLEFTQFGTTVDISNAEQIGIGIADSDGVATITFNVTQADLNQPMIVQAFEMLPGNQKSNTLLLQSTSQMLRAATVGQGGRSLDASELPAVINAAIARWSLAGVSDDALALLRSTEVFVANLPHDAVGRENSGTIVLDIDAAGNGWFVDDTPISDTEFAARTNSIQSTALTQEAASQIDLLTVLVHEFGHVLDLPDVVDPENVMHGTLEIGVRRLPTTNTNFFQPLDANGDSQVSALDALLILNRLDQQSAAGSIGGSTASMWVGSGHSDDMFLDTNADFALSALDALIVLNHLNRTQSENELVRSPLAMDSDQEQDSSLRQANIDASISSLF